MTNEEIKVLAEKVKNNTATPEEELALLTVLGSGVEALRDFLKGLSTEEA